MSVAESTGRGEAATWRLLSQTAQYALHAVLHLASRPAGETTHAAEVAAAIDVPEKYLAQVLNTLAHAGVLHSKRGPRGGFRLERPARSLTLAEIVAPFDTVGGPPHCLLRDRACETGEPCIAHHQWHGMAAEIRSFFQNITAADLLGERGLDDVAANRHPSDDGART